MLNRVLDNQILQAAFYVFTTIVGPDPLDLSNVCNVSDELCCDKSRVTRLFHEVVKDHTRIVVQKADDILKSIFGYR